MAFKRRLFRTTTAATAALVAALALTPRTATAQGCPATPSPSLRLMTYNASFQLAAPAATVGGVFATIVVGPNGATIGSADGSVAYGMADSFRIKEIVDRILVDDPDVFSLQEANKASAQDEFIRLLHGKYPHFVRYVSSRTMELNSGGLMLFSKFPFIDNTTNINNSHASSPPAPSEFGEAETFTNGLPAPVGLSLTNTVVFGDSSASDSLSSKSVAVVKIAHSCFGATPFTVAFTHLQATYDDDDPSDRAHQNHNRLQQFEDIRFAISSSLSAGEMTREPVFLLGDLNVNGMANAIPLLDLGATETHSEWTQTFNAVAPKPANGANPSDLFFACRSGTCTFNKTTIPTGSFFTDSWGFEMPPTDPGQTSPGGAVGGDWLSLGPAEGERLDYILHNKPTSLLGAVPGLCLQYMKRGLEYVASAAAPAAGVQLSDHMPLLADFNTPAPRCSPFPLTPTNPPGSLGPRELTWAPAPGLADIAFNFTVNGSDNIDPTTVITAPGSMQWYHINAAQAGTYVITTDARVRASVYKDDNLSKELVPNEPCTAGTLPPVLPGGTAGSPVIPSVACRYSLPSPPYFIRVYGAKSDTRAPDRTFAGMYGINFHQARCGTAADACILNPATPLTVVWPAAVLAPTDTMFFLFSSESATTGNSPAATLTMSQSSSASLAMTHAVTLGDGTTTVPIDGALSSPAFVPPVVQTTWNTTGGAFPTFSRTIQPAAGAMLGSMGLPAPFFYTAARGSTSVGTSFPMIVEFKTDLTYFDPISLQCIEERTWVGDDDIWGHFVADGALASMCNGGPDHVPPNPDCVAIGMENWNENDAKLARQFVDGRFFKSYTDSFNPQLFEDVIDDGDDFLFMSPADSDPKGIGTLSSTVPTGSTQELVYMDPADPSAYNYKLKFTRSHTKPSCHNRSSFCPAGTTCDPTGLCK